MPAYDFRCLSCAYEFSEILSITDRNIPTESACPNCHTHQRIEMIIGSPALVSPMSVSGLKKPKGDFRERMAQIQQNVRHTTKLKDY